VGDSPFELRRCFLVLERCSFEIVLCHRFGSSSGHGISRSSGNRA
jgi:hypothetical protein